MDEFMHIPKGGNMEGGDAKKKREKEKKVECKKCSKYKDMLGKLRGQLEPVTQKSIELQRSAVEREVIISKLRAEVEDLRNQNRDLLERLELESAPPPPILPPGSPTTRSQSPARPTGHTPATSPPSATSPINASQPHQSPPSSEDGSSSSPQFVEQQQVPDDNKDPIRGEGSPLSPIPERSHADRVVVSNREKNHGQGEGLVNRGVKINSGLTAGQARKMETGTEVGEGSDNEKEDEGSSPKGHRRCSASSTRARSTPPPQANIGVFAGPTASFMAKPTVAAPPGDEGTVSGLVSFLLFPLQRAWLPLWIFFSPAVLLFECFFSRPPLGPVLIRVHMYIPVYICIHGRYLL
ncbi:unnamed protein product [Choristocarpus tenellus]